MDIAMFLPLPLGNSALSPISRRPHFPFSTYSSRNICPESTSFIWDFTSAFLYPFSIAQLLSNVALKNISQCLIGNKVAISILFSLMRCISVYISKKSKKQQKIKKPSTTPFQIQIYPTTYSQLSQSRATFPLNNIIYLRMLHII